jgi:4-amino-4-deoxy-L-arabinose transferase-like glycosyltransferase
MTKAHLEARLLRPAAALRATLIDPERRESTLVLVLFIYWLVWTAYATISKGGQGLHPDMTELIAWSRDPALGYFKHPPLAAWLVGAWFTAFPVSEPAYYLLAMLMPVLALWIAWRLMGDYLDADKRVFGLALLTLVPFFNFHALKYNVNTVLLPLWAVTTFWFLRSYRLRHAGYAALAGLGAAACMYGKYWSVMLLAGLFVAALIDRRRGAYFRSPAPWITAGIGLVALAPHLYWLTENHFAPFSYAVGVHGEKPFTGVLLSTLGYLAGSLAYVALPVAIVLIAARPRPAILADMAWPADDERRLAAAAFWAPLLLPVLGAIAARTEITSLWSMSAWTLLPVVLLSSPAIVLRPVDTPRLLAFAVIFPFAVLAAAPLVARFTVDKAMPESAQMPLLAAQVERTWHMMTPRPLRFVGGDTLSFGVAAYATDRPRALAGLPPPDPAVLKRGGVVFVCLANEESCKASAKAAAQADPAHRIVESTIFRSASGRPTPPQRYTIVLVPPK